MAGMKFFVPHIPDPKTAEAVYQGEIEATQAGPQAKRIFRLTYQHAGKRMVAEVGKEPDPYYRAGAGDVVSIILRSPQCHVIMLAARGLVERSPIYAPADSYAEMFDA